MNADPNAEHQGWYRNKNGAQRIIKREGEAQANADYKYHRGNELAKHMPAVMDKLREGVAAGDPKAEILFATAITAMRIGGENPGERAGQATRGMSTLTGGNIRLDGDKVMIRVVTKGTGKAKHKKDVVTDLGPFDNKELADMLRSKNVPELDKDIAGKNQGHLWPDTASGEITNYWKEFVVGKNGLQLPTAQDPETDQQSGYLIKDMRTYGARTALLEAAEELGEPKTKEQYNEFKNQAIAAVAKKLGNDSDTSEKHYIDPKLLAEVFGDPEKLPNASAGNLWAK
jgi:hypothetical protein